jgi:hypothetical protein
MGTCMTLFARVPVRVWMAYSWLDLLYSLTLCIVTLPPLIIPLFVNRGPLFMLGIVVH